MRSSARVEVIGHLGNDAEAKFTQSGLLILSFNVAHSPYVKDGEKERTNWYRCSLFGERAEKVQQFLVKGTPIRVRGDLDVREWESRDGETRYSLDMRVGELDLLGSKADRETGQTRGRAVDQEPADEDESEIPF